MRSSCRVPGGWPDPDISPLKVHLFYQLCSAVQCSVQCSFQLDVVLCRTVQCAMKCSVLCNSVRCNETVLYCCLIASDKERFSGHSGQIHLSSCHCQGTPLYCTLWRGELQPWVLLFTWSVPLHQYKFSYTLYSRLCTSSYLLLIILLII